MIKYPVRCSQGHEYESWFQNSGAFDRLQATGMLTCEVCGTNEVRKGIAAPRIAKGGRDRSDSEPVAEVPMPMPSEAPADGPPIPACVVEQVAEHVAKQIAESMVDRVRSRAAAMQYEDVGPRIAQEIRDIHDGVAEGRPLKGRATGDEVQALVDDGLITPAPIKIKAETEH